MKGSISKLGDKGLGETQQKTPEAGAAGECKQILNALETLKKVARQVILAYKNLASSAAYRILNISL
jgi:hypothetical protein